jgi:hypothetical protein
VITSALQGCPYSRILSHSEDRELCAFTTIARYRIEQSDLECSSSPLYTVPNTPSSSQLNSEDSEKIPMDSEAEDRISRLESRLSEAREQARVQQNTLNHNCCNNYQSLETNRHLRIPLLPANIVILFAVDVTKVNCI